MDRLSKNQWLDHGLLSLAQSGFTSLKADKLAKSLGVSRGSFYWHFKNLADFHKQLLERWQELAVSSIIESLNETVPTPSDKLKQVIQMGASADPRIEQAIRAWSFNSESVSDMVAQVDAQRLDFLQQGLEEMGGSAEKAFAQARLIYYSYLGQLMLREPISESQRAQVMTELFAFIAA